MKPLRINIKKFRENKGYSLRELARQVNTSASFISQVESGKAEPSLSTLQKIAASLGTTVSYLMGETNEKEVNRLIKETKNQKIQEIEVTALSDSNPHNQMRPVLFKMQKNATSGKTKYSHFGQEFVYVLRGELEIMLDKESYVLRKGDSFYFDSSIPHSFKNIYDGETEALFVSSPPTF